MSIHMNPLAWEAAAASRFKFASAAAGSMSRPSWVGFTEISASTPAARAAGVDAEISVKPTQLGLDIDPAAALANLNRLAAAASHAKGFMWIDMEGSAYTDPTIDLYVKVRAKHR